MPFQALRLPSRPCRPPSPSPYILRYVTSVRLHADPDTGEIFAKVTLDNRPPSLPLPSSLAQDSVSFETNLIASDINWAFTALVGCAERVFPAVNWELDNVSYHFGPDVNDTTWEFNHQYKKKKGLCNSLYRGWKIFVKNKDLKVNAIVIFGQNLAGELVVGIRRASNAGYRARPEAMVKAVMRDDMDDPFLVVFFPIFRPLDILVGVGMDEVPGNVTSVAPMRIEMSKENADSV